MKTSVHLERYPEPFEVLGENLMGQFHAVRGICNAVLSIRNDKGVKVRTPLSSITVYSKEDLKLNEYCGIIADEVNVKKILFSLDFDKVAREKVILNLKVCAAKLGPKTPKVMAAINAGDFEKLPDGRIVAEGQTLEHEDFSVELAPSDSLEGAAFLKVSFSKFSQFKKDILVAVDVNITTELYQEGIARDIVRFIQQDRKNADFSISDVIKSQIKTSSQSIIDVLSQKTLTSYINQQTLTDPNFFKVISERSGNPTHSFLHEIEKVGEFEVLFFENK